MDRTLVLYRRERSSVWQCRFKVDGKWQRATTKERDLEAAKVKADVLRLEAEYRKRTKQPVITRKFKDVANLALKRMEDEKAAGKGKVSFDDYKIVINNYLIPCLGSRNITSIDSAALDDLDAWRAHEMGKSPAQSTILTHNAALNRVFDEGVIRGFLTAANRPKLNAEGRMPSVRRAAFVMEEIQALFAGFERWTENAPTELSKELRYLLRDYVEILLDTGARPGKEIMNLKWNQITFEMDPALLPTGVMEIGQHGEPPEEVVLANLNREVSFPVTGKTGTRLVLGNKPTVEAFERIARRNYDIKNKVTDPFKNVITPLNNDYVIRTKAKAEPTSYSRMFDSYLKEHNLLVDPITGQKRVFYSLRHTHATFALENEGTEIHTLAELMGTSVEMIEKHYSHLNVLRVRAQLRREKTRRLIEIGSGTVSEIYKSTKPARVAKVATPVKVAKVAKVTKKKS